MSELVACPAYHVNSFYLACARDRDTVQKCHIYLIFRPGKVRMEQSSTSRAQAVQQGNLTLDTCKISNNVPAGRTSRGRAKGKVLVILHVS